MIPRNAKRALSALGAAALLFGCGDNPDSVTQPFVGSPRFHLIPIANPEVELMVICKVGPAGTYTFQATASHPILLDTNNNTYSLTSADYTVTVAQGATINVDGTTVGGACTEYTSNMATHNHIAEASGAVASTVTVVETGIPVGQQFVKVDKYQKTGGASGPVVVTSSNVNSVTGSLGGLAAPGTTMGANVVFYNEAIPQTGAGCTPGFWKQTQHFQYWTSPYATSTVISSVFTFPAGGYTTSKGVNVGNSTLLQGLSFGGGPTVGDAAAILLRAGIAALLNAADSDVDYYLDAAGVISAVNTALASGDRTTMLTLASELDFENNRGCTAAD